MRASVIWYRSRPSDELSAHLRDTLSVIEETRNGLYAKKGSVTGWYMGKYELLT